MEIHEKILSLYQTEEEHRSHLGASVIGKECQRIPYYKFRHALKAKYKPESIRLFNRGKAEEAVFVRELRAIGADVYDEDEGEQFQFSDLGGHFGGSMDAVAKIDGKWYVCEFKTHNQSSFRKVAKDGVMVAKPQHYDQMMAYMGWSGIKHALYLAVNKNDDSLYSEIVEFNKDQFDAIRERARSIIFDETIPKRLGAKPDYYKCRMCQYNPICHGMEFPEVNCRTCARATPDKLQPVWHCELGREFGKPCDWHLFHPSLVNGDVVECDNYRIEFAMPDGSRYINRRVGIGQSAEVVPK